MNQPATLRELILKAFGFLFQQFGFSFLGTANDDELIVVAESDDLRLRFIQDRADFFLDISTVRNPEQWIGLYDLLIEMKKKGRISRDYKCVNRVGALSSVLKGVLPEVRAYLAPTG
jgi:hypothetical protein